MRKAKTYKEHLAKLLKNPKFKKEYERFDLWFEIQKLIVTARCWLNMKLRRNK